MADQRRAEQAAADEARRLKDAFLESMSHELRTPLNAIIGFSNILLKNRNGALGKEEIDYVSRIAASGRHLLGLIDDGLTVCERQAGCTGPKREP